MGLTRVILFLALSVFSAKAQDSTQYHYLERIVSFLASDSLQGRACGSRHEKMAADYIYAELKGIKNCKIYRQKFQFSQDSIHYQSENIIGFINNKSKKTIVLSAHYDHLGTGGLLSLSKGSNGVHNGADDNASGVALLLNLAHDLSKMKYDYNFIFIAHSGHELGLHGSKYFSEHLKKKYKSIQLFLNFDMVGRLSEQKVYYDCSSDLLDKLNLKSTPAIQFSKSVHDRLLVLDTKWFVAQQIPSITFSTGRHIDYHKISDDVEYIDFNGILELEQNILNWIQIYPSQIVN